jgi:hypothetical protein
MTIAAVAIGLTAVAMQHSTYAARITADPRATEAGVVQAMSDSDTVRLSQLGLDTSDTVATTDPNFPDIVVALP